MPISKGRRGLLSAFAVIRPPAVESDSDYAAAGSLISPEASLLYKLHGKEGPIVREPSAHL